MGNLCGIQRSSTRQRKGSDEDDEAFEETGEAVRLVPEVLPFDNLSQEEVETLFFTLFELPESFLVDRAGFYEICGALALKTGESLMAMREKAENLFDCFDVEESNVIDAMEVLTALTFIAQFPDEEKINVLFDSLRTSESDLLEFHEIVLGLKSCITGLIKINANARAKMTQEKSTLALDEDLEEECYDFTCKLLQPLFKKGKGEEREKVEMARVSREHFRSLVQSTPEIREIFQIFGAAEGMVAALDLDSDLEIERQGTSLTRDVKENEGEEVRRDSGEDMEVLEGEGDEFMAVKPWKGAIVPPSKPPAHSTKAPDACVTLDWVYGYRAQDTRNNVLYNANQEILFHGAAVGVIFNPKERRQRFELSHTDDILSLAVSPKRDVAASGEVGRTPKIILWDACTGIKRCELKGVQRRGVNQLVFSPDGRSLLSVGMDDDHTIALYSTNNDWKTAELVAVGKGGKEKVLEIQFDPAASANFVICGAKFIDFWVIDGKSLRKQGKATLGKKGKPQVFLCLTWVGEAMVVGTATGELYKFINGELSQVISAHSQALNSVCTLPRGGGKGGSGGGLITGGRDGKILLWDNKLESKKELLAGEFKKGAGKEDGKRERTIALFKPAIRSLCLSPTGNVLLVGTQGSEIFEVDVASGAPLSSTPLLSGHCEEELWGLATHPSKPVFCTAGDDKTVRLWDLESKTMLKMVEVNSPARACAFSPDGNKLAVGLGSGGGEGQGGQRNSKAEKGRSKLEGSVVLLEACELRKVKELHDAKRWISALRFSPDGKVLAAGSHDKAVYLYDIEKNYKKKKPFSRHSSYITHLDFSKDSAVMQTTCGAYELLFSSPSSSQQITSASSVRDVDWATWTCPLGWPVQGIWPSSADGTDINAVDRSHDRQLLATADDRGDLKIFSWPCVSPDSQSVDLHGHSSHVTNVRWSHDDRYILTTGGNDRCILQWKKHTPEGDVGRHKALNNAKAVLDDEEDIREPSPLEEELSIGGEGDEFMAVKPWVGAIVAPSHPPPCSPALPPAGLELDWVHGYQGQNGRNNVRYTSAADLVWHTAAVGVVYSTSNNTQRFFVGHTDDILCLAVHPSEPYVATGQMGKAPTICVWSSAGSDKMLPTISTLKGFHKRGVSSLCFSCDGTLLGSVGEDDDHSIAVYSWKDASLLASAKGDKAKILSFAFSSSSSFFATCGVKHLKFWTMQGRNLTAKKAVFSSQTTLQTFSTVVFVGGQWAVAAGDGSILIFDQGGAIAKVLKAHQGPVLSLFAVPEPKAGKTADKVSLVSGGKDGEVHFWYSSMEKRETVPWKSSMKQKEPGYSYALSSVCLMPDHKLLLGTKESEVYEYLLKPGKLGGEGEPIVSGHFSSELWGLAMHPHRDVFATVGDDRSLRLWNLKGYKCIRRTFFTEMARACAFSPDGRLIAVGHGGRVGKGKQKNDGLVTLHSAETLELLYSCRPSKDWISDIKFSPKGDILAVGSHDNSIHLFRVLRDKGPERKGGDSTTDGKGSAKGGGPEKNIGNAKSKEGERCYLEKLPPFSRHSAYITHLDFSEDGKVMQSTCGGYELLFSSPTTGQQISSAKAVRDTQWATWTCPLGWPVQGIWPAGADGTQINAVARSKDKMLLVSADDWGKVRLFRYPCTDKKAQSLIYMGHSSHVSNVRWSHDDKFLVSCGGNDRSIFQWKCKRDEEEATTLKNKDQLERDEKIVNGDNGKASYKPTIEGNSSADSSEAQTDSEDEEDLDLPSVPAGDEFMAVKPWLGAIVPPSNAPVSNTKAPEVKLEIGWVHGFACVNVRNNLKYADEGRSILYHTAALGIIYRPKEHTQSHYVGHTDDILCLDLSPSGKLVATGQMGKNAAIHIWTADKGEKVAVSSKFHQRSVLCVSFSPDGKKLASIGGDDDHSVAVWETVDGSWKDMKLAASSKGDRSNTLFAAFSMTGELVTGGVKHIRFWSINGKTLSCKKGQFGKDAVEAVICGEAVGQALVATGTSGGEVLLWNSGKLEKRKKEHKGPINALHFQDGRLISGGRDGHIVIWDDGLSPLSKLEVPQTSLSVAIQSVISHPAQSSLFLVGTQGGEVLEFDGESKKMSTLIHSHFKGELWGLATCPVRPEFCTVGDDETVRLWSLSTRRLLALEKLKYRARACAYSLDGRMIAIGYGGDVKLKSNRTKTSGGGENMDGYVAVIDEDTLRKSGQLKFLLSPKKLSAELERKPISDLKFSPKGSYLAVGSHDRKIYILDARDGFKHLCTFSGHNSYITHFDFSSDEQFLQSNCGAYELLFYSVANKKQITSASSVKDVAWSSWTCTLGWPVQGIWPAYADGTDINTVCASQGRAILASGDDTGQIKLFRYPCTAKGAQYCTGLGHASHVTTVRFSLDSANVDKYLVSTGGNDRSIIQWRVVT